MPTTTRTLLKQGTLDWWNAHFDEVLRQFAMPRTTTATAANSSGLRDTALARGTTAANRYDARHIEVVEKVGSGPEIGETSVVDDAGFDNADLLAISPAFTAALESGADYLIYGHGLSPEVLNKGINTVLRYTEGPHLWFPSLLTDAELEDSSSLGTNWPTVGTPSTGPTLGTTAANALLGAGSVRFVADATGEGFQSAAIAVTEQETLLVSVFVRCDVSDVIVSLYDETNGEVIGNAVTIDEQAWTEVRFAYAAPTGCEQVRVRFLSNSTDSDIYVSAPIILQSQWGRTYITPSWFTRKEQVLEALEFPQGYTSEENYSYAALSRRALPHDMPSVLRNDRGLNPFLVEFKAYNRPVALVVYRTFDELSSNAATTPCDREYVMWKTLANILLARGEDAQAFTCRQRATAAAANKRYGLHERRMVENEVMVV